MERVWLVKAWHCTPIQWIWSWVSLIFGLSASGFSQTVDSFDPGTNSSISGIYALAIQPDDRILVGGIFTTLDGQTRNNLARLNTDGTLDDVFNPAVGSYVTSLAVQTDGKILVGGWFTNLCGQTRNYIGRLNSNGTLDEQFSPRVDFGLRALCLQPDGKILLGGSFTNVERQRRFGIARLNPDGTLDQRFVDVSLGWYTNKFLDGGYVSALALQSDGKILIGGRFITSVGGSTRDYFKRLFSDGSTDFGFESGANNNVQALAILPSGQILAGGSFTTMHGQTRNRIARCDIFGNVDSGFNPGANNVVDALALQADGKVVVAGGFTTISGKARNYLARLNNDGTLDTEFNPSPNRSVWALALQTDGHLLTGGNFTNLAGQPRNCIGRLNSNDSATNSLMFDSSRITWVRGGTTPEFAWTMADVFINGTGWTNLGGGTRVTNGWQWTRGQSLVTNTTLRVRGAVTTGEYNGSSSFMELGVGPVVIARQPVNCTNNGGTIASFSVDAVGEATLSYQWCRNGADLADGGCIFGARSPTLTISNVLGGHAGFYTVVISNRYNVLTSTVATLTVIDPSILTQPAIQATNSGSTVSFSVLAGGTAPLAYQWRKNGVALPQSNGATLTISNVQFSDKGAYDVVVSNQLGSTNSSAAQLTILAAPDSFDPEPDDIVLSVAMQSDGKTLIGGGFYTVGGQPRNHLARLRVDGSLDEEFDANIDDSVGTLGVQADGKILIGGEFTHVGGQMRNCIARINANGSLDNMFHPDAGGTTYPGVYSIAVQRDGKILVGGNFTTLGEQTRNYIGRLNADGNPDPTFNPGADNYVSTMAVQPDGMILVGGYFNTLAGQPRSQIARLDLNGGLDLGFNPGANAQVNCLAVQPDGRILVGGAFTELAGKPRNHIGRLNPDGSLDSGFNPSIDGDVYTCTINSLEIQADGKILIGGSFTSINGQSRNCIARLNNDGSPDTEFYPFLGGGNVYSLALRDNGQILAGGASIFMPNGQRRPFVCRLNNTDGANESLSFDASTVTWLRGGTAPEIWRVTFESSDDGVTWNPLGEGHRIANGWQLSGVQLTANVTVRARGFVTGGFSNNSNWFVETMAVGYSAPAILARDNVFGVCSRRFGFNFVGRTGQTIIVECSSNLQDWLPLATNTFGSGAAYFSDPEWTNRAWRFYRAVAR